MSDKEEYINVSNLKKNFVNDDYDPENNTEWVYQFQPKDKTNKSLIMGVGQFTNVEYVPDIMINQFNISDKQSCIITSFVYNKKELIDMEKECNFPLIKIVINHNHDNELLPIGCLMLVYHTFNHIQAKKSIINYLSDSKNKIYMEGFFSFSFHFKDKKMVLEKFKEINNISKSINKMIEYLVSTEIRETIDQLVSEI